MLSPEDQRYVERHQIPHLSNFIVHHLCNSLPENPYGSLAQRLSEIASPGSSIPDVPHPQRPLPATQRDYLNQHRVSVIIEEWLFEVLLQKPTEPVQYSYRYFLRNSQSRYAQHQPQSSLTPNERNTQSQSPLHGYDPRRSPYSNRASPLVHYGISGGQSGDEGGDGYLGDVSPRGGSSRGASPHRPSSVSPGPVPPPDSDVSASTTQCSVSPPDPSREPQIPREVVSPLTVSPASSMDPSSRPAPMLPPRVKVLIIVYSHHGHCRELGLAALAALHDASDIVVDAHLYRAAEVLTPEVLEKMHAEHFEDDDPRYIPEFTDTEELVTYDAFLFIFPTRFGSRPAAVQTLIDTTGGLWARGALVGKPVGTMVCTSTQHGGHETTCRSFQRSLMHHGCILVGVNPLDLRGQGIEDVEGCSYYGAGTISGPDGSRTPSSFELAVAGKHALRVATVAAKLL